MYCSNCGKEVDDNAKFCRFCGQAVSVAKSENRKADELIAGAVQASDTVAAADVKMSARQEEASTPTEKSAAGEENISAAELGWAAVVKQKRMPIVVGIIAFFIIVGMGVGYYAKGSGLLNLGKKEFNQFSYEAELSPLLWYMEHEYEDVDINDCELIEIPDGSEFGETVQDGGAYTLLQFKNQKSGNYGWNYIMYDFPGMDEIEEQSFEMTSMHYDSTYDRHENGQTVRDIEGTLSTGFTYKISILYDETGRVSALSYDYNESHYAMYYFIYNEQGLVDKSIYADVFYADNTGISLFSDVNEIQQREDIKLNIRQYEYDNNNNLIKISSNPPYSNSGEWIETFSYTSNGYRVSEHCENEYRNQGDKQISRLEDGRTSTISTEEKDYFRETIVSQERKYIYYDDGSVGQIFKETETMLD